MLVLRRKVGDSIFIDTSDGPIEIRLIWIGQNAARIGVNAPDDVEILRGEIVERETAAESKP